MIFVKIYSGLLYNTCVGFKMVYFGNRKTYQYLKGKKISKKKHRNNLHIHDMTLGLSFRSSNHLYFGKFCFYFFKQFYNLLLKSHILCNISLLTLCSSSSLLASLLASLFISSKAKINFFSTAGKCSLKMS